MNHLTLANRNQSNQKSHMMLWGKCLRRSGFQCSAPNDICEESKKRGGKEKLSFSQNLAVTAETLL